MSLIDDFMDKCTMIDRVTRPDGYGGFVIEYMDGATFDAAITLNTSMEARTAEQAGVTALYTITTQKNINLQYHDIFRRGSDGKIFRIKSDGDDKYTPKSATLNMRQVTAEEYTLPS